MKTGNRVNVNRKSLAPTLAAVLPSFIFWNPGVVSKTSKTSGVKRVCVRWSGIDPLWFDAEAVTAVTDEPVINFEFAKTYVWMKNGTLPVAAKILEIKDGSRVRIRTMNGTRAIDRTVKMSSIQEVG